MLTTSPIVASVQLKPVEVNEKRDKDICISYHSLNANFGRKIELR